MLLHVIVDWAGHCLLKSNCPSAHNHSVGVFQVSSLSWQNAILTPVASACIQVTTSCEHSSCHSLLYLLGVACTMGEEACNYSLGQGHTLPVEKRHWLHGHMTCCNFAKSEPQPVLTVCSYVSFLFGVTDIGPWSVAPSNRTLEWGACLSNWNVSPNEPRQPFTQGLEVSCGTITPETWYTTVVASTTMCWQHGEGLVPSHR